MPGSESRFREAVVGEVGPILAIRGFHSLGKVSKNIKEEIGVQKEK